MHVLVILTGIVLGLALLPLLIPAVVVFGFCAVTGHALHIFGSAGLRLLTELHKWQQKTFKR